MSPWRPRRPLSRALAGHIMSAAVQFVMFLLYMRGVKRTNMTVWPSRLKRWLQAPVRKGVGSNPTAVRVCTVLMTDGCAAMVIVGSYVRQ